ncbi:hypothetical protein K504DRAFT_232461 [Pleomassaria siparia CBS 279.74]|uniref:Secreted protein n=1 Tax=Pleomassaria siparia CBS 279.74 TaxID=1314801 RepID=A0A6G1KGE9_9PLEO|nr:hypothetical protein K504DRAFT_232461 [Pleomassaria siparia CBS 279.74]
MTLFSHSAAFFFFFPSFLLIFAFETEAGRFPSTADADAMADGSSPDSTQVHSFCRVMVSVSWCRCHGVRNAALLSCRTYPRPCCRANETPKHPVPILFLLVFFCLFRLAQWTHISSCLFLAFFCLFPAFLALHNM